MIDKAFSQPRLHSSQSHFSKIPQADIPRSVFDRSHGFKSTFDAGLLIPFFVDEALPGDTFSVNMAGFARLATPLYPIMDNMRLETFFFAVPYRLVWVNWAKFCGERKSPNDSVDFLIPEVEISDAANESIYDYFGLPTKITEAYKVSALPFRAYNLIWNEWFRDQNLQTPTTVNTGNGPDTEATYTLKKRGKRHDYFTSCLPWLQKGDAIQLSLGERAPVSGIGKFNATFINTNQTVYDSSDVTGSIVYPHAAPIDTGAAESTWYGRGTAASGNVPDIYADLSQATASTVNELRQAIQV